MIEIITGPMFAGKTTKLLSLINNCGFSKEEKLIFNYANDKRYSSTANVTSHNNVSYPSIPITDCFEIKKYITTKTKIVFIDEIHFMKNIKNWYQEIISNDNYDNINQHDNINQQHEIKYVIVGLNFDIYGNFLNPEFNYIIDKTRNITYLKSKCYICKNNADFTILINNNNEINETNNKVVGGSETYQPVCFIHALQADYKHNFKNFIAKIM